jgi:hypothetical protein
VEKIGRALIASPESEFPGLQLHARVTLPAGGKLGIYQPLQASPAAHVPGAVPKRKTPAMKKRASAKKTGKRSWR